MSELEWKEPAHGRPRYGRGMPPLTDWYEVAEQLKSQPRKWALVLREVPRAHATRINKGENAAFRDGLYEATSVKCGSNSNKGDLYVRYLGPWKEGGTP